MSTPLIASVTLIVLSSLVSKGAFQRPVSPQYGLSSWPDSASIEGLMEHDDVTNAIGFETAPNSKRSAHSKSSSTDRSSLALLSGYRGSGHSFCSCQSEYDLIDLGPLRFPRYIRQATCPATPCWKSPYVCQQLHYRVPILVKRPELPEDGDDRNAGDDNLPESLRRQWRIELTKVAVACECAV